MKRLAIACAVISLAVMGCEKPASTIPRAANSLRFTSGEQGRKFTQETRHVDRPFLLAPQGVNGTALVLKYLQDLQASGATFVSGMRYEIQLRRGEVPLECVSKIIVEDGSTRPAVASTDTSGPDAPGEVEYETTVKSWQPGTTNAWVVDRNMVCADHAQQVVVKEPRYENRYDAEIKRYYMPSEVPVDEDMKIVHYNVCEFAPARRHVRRYDHFLATKFMPPDLDAVRERYSDWKLTEAPPVCHEIKVDPGKPLLSHIEADAHYSGSFEGISEPEITLYPIYRPIK